VVSAPEKNCPPGALLWVSWTTGVPVALPRLVTNRKRRANQLERASPDYRELDAVAVQACSRHFCRRSNWLYAHAKRQVAAPVAGHWAKKYGLGADNSYRRDFLRFLSIQLCQIIDPDFNELGHAPALALRFALNFPQCLLAQTEGSFNLVSHNYQRLPTLTKQRKTNFKKFYQTLPSRSHATSFHRST